MARAKVYKPYKIPTRKGQKLRSALNRPRPLGNDPDELPLTGFIGNQKASDLEERFYRAVRKVGLAAHFQVEMPVSSSVGGQGKQIDFVVLFGGLPQPVEIDGQIGHSTGAQRGADAVRDSLLNAKFTQIGWAPVIRIPYWKLRTEEQAYNTVREMFLGR